MQVNPVVFVMPLFVFFILIELSICLKRGLPYYRLNDAVNSLSLGILMIVGDLFAKGAIAAAYFYTYNLWHLWQWSAQSPWTWLVAFVLVDFCYYWYHRCSHEINFLWGSHVAHHQSEEYNLTTALRQGVFQQLFSCPFYLFLALLGIPLQVFILQYALVKLYQFWLHTRLIGKLGWLEGLMVTPSAHRVHHGRDLLYINKNYGGTFALWDRFFGTYQPELHAPDYGITKPLQSWNPIWANFHWWVGLSKDMLQTALWRDKLKLWFMPTGWRPADVAHADLSLDQVKQPEQAKNELTLQRPLYNPAVTKTASIYALINLFALIIITPWFLLTQVSWSGLQTGLMVLFIIFSLYNIALVISSYRFWPQMELARLVLIVTGLYYFANTY